MPNRASRRSTIPAFLVVLLLLCGSATAQNYLKKAEKLYSKGLYSLALDQFLAEYTRNTSAHAAARAAECCIAMRDYPSARAWYEKVAAANALEAVDRFNYGVVLKTFGLYEQAREQFVQYLQAFPEDTAAQRYALSCNTARSLADSSVYYRAEPATDLNTARDEYSPVWYQGGIVFVSNRDADTTQRNPVNGRPMTDLYFGRSVGDRTFLGVQPLAGLNSIMADGPVTFNLTQDMAIFSRLVDRNGNPAMDRRNGEVFYKLFSASRSGDSWGSVTQLATGKNDKFHYMQPAFNADYTKLYFASNREGGYGGFDLWVSEYHNGRWGEPYNLGPTINTEGQEGYPYVHADGTLYFSSDLREGLGGYDVFIAHERFNSWSNIENLRPGINSPQDDFGVLLNEDKTEGMVSSDRAGNEDLYYIFRVNIPNSERPTAQQPLAQNNPPAQSSGGAPSTSTARAEYLIVAGSVVEQLAQRNGNDWNRTQGMILDNALIALLNKQTGRPQNQITGSNFSFQLDNPDNYVLVAKQNGYYATRIDLATADRDLTRMTILLEKIVLNEPNPNGLMPNLQYNFNSAALTGNTQQALGRVARLLKDNPEIVLELAGHACPIGDAAYNQRLSESRSSIAAQYLMGDEQIPANRLIIRGYGESKPLQANGSRDDLAINRRVEFIVRSVSNRAEGAMSLNDMPSSSPSAEVLQAAESLRTQVRFAGTATAPESPAAAPVQNTNPNVHVVRAGDTLYSIARLHNLTVEKLMQLNALHNSAIQQGQELRLR
jgi:outer membrane protein OmpA-like peptidoglycan-associated protein/tetratricopeptide (TPR) repeat protein